ncbi:YdiK family protein [Lederbergia graminis]|uniref:YdiK family protein n=1 Tax=Lederbergia graminis TaxID=735518 RepID=A0ABW0LE94_9BACI|nr:YdiK family protein [Paenibacillus bovis]HLU22073.1 YdiK family protein [Bacillaceae bacterium]
MVRSPLSSGIINIILGVLFTYFAIQQVKMNDWNFFVYILLLIATFDFGAGFRLIAIHFKLKNMKKNQ